MDGDQALPSDTWIETAVPAADAAFDVSFDVLYGRLGWLELVRSAIRPTETTELSGIRVGRYDARLPAADVTKALKAGHGDDPEPLLLQGEIVSISFWVDSDHRLRRMLVQYKADDRQRTFTATVHDLGLPVTIEPPPRSEIFDEAPR